ncbi:MAG TPA: DUF3515 domain-containing protein [Micromonosporaceae bacterium]
MTDAPARSAGWLAAMIALPIALVVGLVVFLTLHHKIDAAAAAKPAPSASASADTSPVSMPAPAMSAANKQMCLAFIAALPVKLRNLPERHVTQGPEQNAAFGTPPITAECGATEPSVAATAEIFPISGVCWYAEAKGDTTVWTTLDRVVPVAVTIPNSYDGAGQWAAEFRDAIVSAILSKKTTYNC